jgi:tetratricopeptide (TPR) repeat protein
LTCRTSEGGIPAKRALCEYIGTHSQKGSQNLAQFVSLALFLTPPPQLALSFPENEMPPDALNVVNVLPLLRTFSQTVHLHALWVAHHQDYEAAVAQVHDSVTRMLLETNVYLHQPASSYDGRRFLVLLEPMLSPEAVNARIYGSDYFVVASASPADAATQNAGIRLDEIRHVYLLYEIDPIIYARASSTNRLLPILKTVQDAPIDFVYKNDIVSFTTECLIKAIEARTMDVGIEKPKQVVNGKARLDPAGYAAALGDYDRKADAVRRRTVIADMRSGWVLTQYFYDKLSLTDREGISLKDNMGELVYGMDVGFEASRDKRIPFFAEGSPELVGTAGSTQRGRALPRVLSPMDKAELALQRGDRAGAEQLANGELAANPSSVEAKYVLARVDLLEGDAEKAFDLFDSIAQTAKPDTRDNARTLAWAHVYLGRMYDSALAQPDRAKALGEYRAALTVPGTGPDVQSAAEAGLKQPFAAPRRATAPAQEDDNEPLDPTGKKQKDSYVPDAGTPK